MFFIGYDYVSSNIGKPCTECGDTMDDTHSALIPTWSNYHDNVVCFDCYTTWERIGQ